MDSLGVDNVAQIFQLRSQTVKVRGPEKERGPEDYQFRDVCHLVFNAEPNGEDASMPAQPADAAFGKNVIASPAGNLDCIPICRK
jgi:hypothetical protein